MCHRRPMISFLDLERSPDRRVRQTLKSVTSSARCKLRRTDGDIAVCCADAVKMAKLGAS